MPGIQGPDLVRRARGLRPGLAALLISGYARELIERTVDPDVRLLEKPFDAAALGHAVRAAIDRTG